MQSMIGFRNIAVHDYLRLDMDIVMWVIQDGLKDLLTFTDEIRQL